MSECNISKLPDEILEKVFCYLDFSSLIATEMTCRRWHKLVNERRLFWQLAKNIAKSEVVKKKPRPHPGGGRARGDVLASAARDVRRQANMYKRRRLI